jgi:hypothetical protein
MSTSGFAQASNQEGKILLAIQAHKARQVSSLRKASALYSVPPTSLWNRSQGRTTRENAQLQNRKLSPTEEATLIQWILSMDERGKSPRIATIQEMANILLASRGRSFAATVGVNWANRFINRHNEI